MVDSKKFDYLSPAQQTYNTRFVCKWLERAGQGGGAGACSAQWAMWPDMRGSPLSTGKSMVMVILFLRIV